MCLFACGESSDSGGNAGVADGSAPSVPRVEDVTVEYDGLPHGIIVCDTEPGDVEYYSYNGGWSEDEPLFVEPGAYEVFYKNVREGRDDFVASALVTITRTRLDTVSPRDAVILAGGTTRDIEIFGTADGDKIEFSLDGAVFCTELAFTDVGEHEVFYRLERPGRGYADGKLKVTVLPDMSGTYVADDGIAVVDGYTLTINGESRKLSCGADGRGGTLFIDGELYVDGTPYRRVGDGERAYCIAAGDITRYVIGGDSVDIAIRFDDGGADIFADGNKMAHIDGVNYCESAEGINISREYSCSDVEFETSDIDIRIALSCRDKQNIAGVAATFLYDGSDRFVMPIGTGDVMYYYDGAYSTQPVRCVDVGEYTYDVIFLSNKYLPAVAHCSVTVYPDMSGVYYSLTGVIEIDGDVARRDGRQVELHHTLGGGTIDGENAVMTSDGMTVGDTAYVRADGPALMIIASTRYVFVPTDDVYVRKAGDSITVEYYGGDVLFESDIADGVGGAKLNGELLTDITGENGEYVITLGDMRRYAVAFLTFE